MAWRNGSVPEMAAAFDRVGGLDPHALRAKVQQRFSAEAMVAGYERVNQRVFTGGTWHSASWTAEHPCLLAVVGAGSRSMMIQTAM